MESMTFDYTASLNELPVYAQSARTSSLLNQARLFLGADKWVWIPYGAPGVPDNLIPARGTFEAQIAVSPGSYLLYITGRSDQAAGFHLQLYDEGAKRYVMSIYARDQTVAGQGRTVAGAGFPPANGPYWLPSPLPILYPGVLIATFTNLAAVLADIQCCFFLACPLESLAKPEGAL